MIFPILGLFIGLALGFLAPVLVPFALAKYFSVAILAAFDAVFGGLRSAVYDKFDNEVFVTGFFSNALMAAFLVFLGDKLGIDLYYVALLAFGFRIFKNLALLRRWILKKHHADA